MRDIFGVARTRLRAGTWHWLFLGGAILLGTALRFHALADKSLWGDEIMTAVFFVRMPAGYIATHFHPNNHTLFSLLARLFTLYGSNEFLLRAPSALLGIAAIPAIYSLGRIVFAPATGLVAAYLLAISPYHLVYSQQARGYSAAMLFSLVSILFLFLIIKQVDYTRRRQIFHFTGFIGATALAIYTHMFAIVFFGAELLVLGGYALAKVLPPQRTARSALPPLRLWVLGLMALGLLLAVLFAPLWLALLSVIDEAHASIYTGSLNFSTDFELGFASFERLALRYGGSWAGRWQAGAAVSLGFFAFGLAIGLGQRKRLAVALAALMLIPFLFIAILTVLWSDFYIYSRFLIFLYPIYTVFTAFGIISAAGFARGLTERRRDLARVTATVALVCAFSVLSIEPLRVYYGNDPQDWRGAAKLLEHSVRPGDAVVGLNWADVNITYYAPELQIQKLAGKTPEELATLLQQYQRLWYVRDWGLSRTKPELETWVREGRFQTTNVGNVLISVASQEQGLGGIEDQGALLEKAVDSSPSAENLLQLGEFYMQQGRVGEALEQFQQAVALRSEWGLAHTKLGNAYNALGQVSDAERAYCRSIEVEPDYVGAYIRLGGVHSSQGRSEEALELYLTAVQLAPTSAWAHSALGGVYHELGYPEKALTHLERAVELEANNAVWLLALASAYRDQGLRDEAMDAYSRVLALNPDNRQAIEALQLLEP